MFIISKLTKPFIGKVQFYSFFKRLNTFSRRAMNFGTGWDFQGGGEINFLAFLKKLLSQFENKFNYFRCWC